MQAEPHIEQAIFDVLDRFNEAIKAADLDRVMELFADDPDVCLMGSGANEVAVGPTQIRRQMQNVLSRVDVLWWSWDRRAVSASGNVAWAAVDALPCTCIPRRASSQSPIECPSCLSSGLDNGALCCGTAPSQPVIAPLPPSPLAIITAVTLCGHCITAQ